MSSTKQSSNKREREEATAVAPPMREPESKKIRTDFRGFYDFDTDRIESDDGEIFDDLESEADCGLVPHVRKILIR
jgi:hypothetical protein